MDILFGKYVSIEKIVENTKESYYETLKNSSINWYNNSNDYIFFSEYYLSVILRAYKDFSNRIEYMTNKKMTAKERILLLIDKNISKISKKQITEICPDISVTTIEKALNELINEELILKIGDGRYTSYIINNKI